MNCLQCGQRMKSGRENYLYKESGLPNITLVGIEVNRCPGCGEYEAVIPKIEQLHREALVWDSHNDLSYRVLYEGLDISQRLPAGHVDIPRLKEGGVDVQTVALFVQNFLYPHPGECARQARQLLEAMKEAIEKNSGAVELARTGTDIERIVSAGKIAMPLAIEGGHAIEDDLELLREFQRLGV